MLMIKSYTIVLNNYKYNKKKGYNILKKIIVTEETQTGRNKTFLDQSTGKTMSRVQFCDAIESGKYKNFHVAKINGKRTPRSNPDKNTLNNLD